MFLKEHAKRITYRKDVKVRCGCYENEVNYIEIDWGIAL